MRLKKFKLFESKSEDYFPSFEEVKEYFYDFTDELNITIDYFGYGYKYFLKAHTVGDLNNNYDKILKDESNYIDILNTELPNKKLLICSDYVSIEVIFGTINGYNREKEVGSDLSIQAIKAGAKAYNHIIFEFSDSCIITKECLPKLVECLKRFYHETNFRPYGEIYLQERPIRNGDVDKNSGIESGDESVLFYGFCGLFVDCSDEEYKKLCEIYSKEHPSNVLITKYFL